LRKEESSENVSDELSGAFKKVKAKKLPLLRSIFTTNKGKNCP